jgi:hypothetical protein
LRAQRQFHVSGIPETWKFIWRLGYLVEKRTARHFVTRETFQRSNNTRRAVVGRVTESAIGCPKSMKPHCRPDIIPANIVGFLAALPRTGLGKIDREKLEAINRPK